MSYSWVTPKAKIKNTKAIKGRGLFAIKNIKKGEVAAISGGKIVPAKDLNSGRQKSHCFQISQRFYLCPIKNYEAGFIVNHSCNPNLGMVDSLTLVALKNILTGEELCYDYAMTDSFDGYPPYSLMKCCCGSKNCRGWQTDSDWKLKKLQKRYKGYFSPYLEKKILKNK